MGRYYLVEDTCWICDIIEWAWGKVRENPVISIIVVATWHSQPTYDAVRAGYDWCDARASFLGFLYVFAIFVALRICQNAAFAGAQWIRKAVEDANNKQTNAAAEVRDENLIAVRCERGED